MAIRPDEPFNKNTGGFRSGSTWNAPGASRPATTAPAPRRFDSTPNVLAPQRTGPAKVFGDLISRAARIATTPKVGPRGTTIEDMQRVVQTGFTPARTPAPAPTVPAIDQSAVLAGMIGGPAPTHGQKYGGMPSASYFVDLVRGDATNILAAQQMAQEEARRLAAPIEEQYAYNLDPKRGGLAGEKLQESTRILSQPMESLARQMAGGAPSRRDMYGAAMARMNAVRGTGDYMVPDEATGQLRPASGREQILANAAQSALPVAEAQRERDMRLFGATRAQELADAMNVFTPSELMQKIAVEKYGYDPALAAGLFPVSENLDYQQMQNDAYKAQIMQEYGFDPDASVAEIILYTQGPEALQQYQLQQAEYAMNGTPTQQLSAMKNEKEAEDALFDEEARVQYGIDPGRVSGIDPDYMRSLLEDENFVTIFTEARNAIVEGADPLEESSKAGADYARASGDMLGASAMAKVLASFDLQSFA